MKAVVELLQLYVLSDTVWFLKPGEDSLTKLKKGFEGKQCPTQFVPKSIQGGKCVIRVDKTSLSGGDEGIF